MQFKKIISVVAIAQILLCNVQASCSSVSFPSSTSVQSSEALKLEQIAHETIKNRLQSLTPIPYTTEVESSVKSSVELI